MGACNKPQKSQNSPNIQETEGNSSDLFRSRSNLGSMQFAGIFSQLHGINTRYNNIRNKYEFLKIQGHGKLGIVRVAKLKQGNHKIAVKSIPKVKISADAHALRSELGILAIVDHPNIIKYHEIYEDEKFLHITMEFCSGGELFDRIINKGTFSEAEACDLTYKILHAINHLHQNQICHRNLKPENLLFENKTASAEIKIADFNFSNKFSDHPEEDFKKLGSAPATSYYIAPEVIRNQRGVECDLWSVGIIMYVLLAGHPPFSGSNNAETQDAILKGEFSFPQAEFSSISSSAKDLITQLLKIDTNERITAQQAMDHNWFKSEKSYTHIDVTVINALRRFRMGNNLRREVLDVIVKRTTNEQMDQLTETFRKLDKDRTGFITVWELQESIAELDMQISKEEIQDIVDNADYQGNGKINYTEFIVATLDAKKVVTKEVLWAAFKHFDVDDTDYITADNLIEAFEMSGKQVNEQEIEAMIAEGDQLKDNRISFQEFTNLMTEYDLYSIDQPLRRRGTVQARID